MSARAESDAPSVAVRPAEPGLVERGARV
jgi:hypothetical protein